MKIVKKFEVKGLSGTNNFTFLGTTLKTNTLNYFCPFKICIYRETYNLNQHTEYYQKAPCTYLNIDT